MNQSEKKNVWDLEICKNIELLKEAGMIILYGAGGKGKDTFEWLNEAEIDVSYFCDMDMKKWGENVEGVEILSPFMLKEAIRKTNQPVYIIACIPFPQELCDLLNHVRLNRMRMITYWGVKTALQINAEKIYEKKTRRIEMLKIEKGIKKNIFIYAGIKCLQDIVTASEDTIWIIQPGKTASTSLENRLKECNLSFIKEHHLEYPAHVLGEDYRNIWEKRIQESRRGLKVIVAVREPLSRDYSAFWQAFTEGMERSTLMPILQGDFQQMYNSFIELILSGSAYTKEKLGVSMPYMWNDEFNWFDEQIKKYLNIDVFQHPFDREKGYTIIKKENIDLLLFKIEKMESILDVISSFVGVARLPVVNANVAEQKWYGLAYSQFRKEIKLSEEYIRHYYQGNVKMDYFYTDEEKDGFLDRWKCNIQNKNG